MHGHPSTTTRFDGIDEKAEGRASRTASPVWGRGRELLLRAAHELFAERGYAGASTKEIAERANLSESMLFRHFGSKAGLFREAVLAPFQEYMSEFLDDWEARPRGGRDPVDEARDLYRGLYQLLDANRNLVRALIAAELTEGPLLAGGIPVGAILERFEKVAMAESEIRRFRPLDPCVVTRLMFGMAFAVALGGDVMYAGASTPTPEPEAFIEEMAMLTIHGTLSTESP